MLLFNAADEITDLAPLDVSPGIKHSAMKFYRMIVDLVENGEIEAFEKNSVFRSEIREFIRNLSRMADELLPFVSLSNLCSFSLISNLLISRFNHFDPFCRINSEDSRILRDRVPKERKSDRAYFIFYMKVAYAFSLTFK